MHRVQEHEVLRMFGVSLVHFALVCGAERVFGRVAPGFASHTEEVGHVVAFISSVALTAGGACIVCCSAVFCSMSVSLALYAVYRLLLFFPWV
jgi:hypothetical protein